MQFTQFSRIATRAEIDIPNAVIKGVSVITEGEAVGHNLVIDKTTLSQVAESASKFADGLKVRFNHPSKGKSASVTDNAGVLKNFRVEGSHTRADLYLLKTVSETPQILEMAAMMPESFGLSIVFSGENEKKDGQNCARCSDIYACDLVDDPAANPTGLFSKPTESKSMLDKIKTMLGFAPTATEDEIVTSLAAKQQEAKSAELKTQLSEALKEALKPLETKLQSLESKDAANIALAKKTEIDALVSEASKEGKILPLEAADIYEVKDGVTTIKVEPSMLRKMIEKLPKAQVQLSRKVTVPQSTDGTKKFERGSTEWVEFYAKRREAGAAELTQKFQNIN